MRVVLWSDDTDRKLHERVPTAVGAVLGEDPMLCLNLACGPAGLDKPGMVNLDKDPLRGDGSGWTFESGLPAFPDGSVDGITVSHGLMYVAMGDLPAFFREAHRALRVGGVIRITEDAATCPESRHWFGHEPIDRSWDHRVTPSDAGLMVALLRLAGFDARIMNKDSTLFVDRRLMQNTKAGPPHVYFVEGFKRSPLHDGACRWCRQVGGRETHAEWLARQTGGRR